MTQQTAPRSIDQYLRQLREALAGEDNALVQDALYDAEEYLRAELAAAKALTPPQSEADVLERIASTYGAPEEVAAAYRTTEAKVTAALRLPPPLPKQTAMGRFFSVYSDSRTWGALFYLLLAMFTGIFYFTTAAVGLSLSLGLAILIIGVPFFLLFIGFTRVLSLAEGRLVESLLGVRMPRRPLTRTPGTWWERIKEMLGDWRTWTTLIYMGLQLPLGIFYFVLNVVGMAFSLAFLALPFSALFNHGEMVFGNINGVKLTAEFHGLEFVVVPLLGVLLLTTLMHVVRGLGQLHGRLAKALLVSRTADSSCREQAPSYNWNDFCGSELARDSSCREQAPSYNWNDFCGSELARDRRLQAASNNVNWHLWERACSRLFDECTSIQVGIVASKPRGDRLRRMVTDARWKQRFDNFDRAFALLREALASGGAQLNQLEREGTIHRFEYTFELSWKAMKDYLEAAGVAMPTLTPRAIIEAALAAGVIREGHVWTDMLRQRNLLAHTYNLRHSDDALAAIETRYLAEMAQLHAWLAGKLQE